MAEPESETEKEAVPEEAAGARSEGPAGAAEGSNKAVWIRGLQMLILAVCFGIAETILALCAVLQFGWMLLAKRRNENIAAFGESLADWLERTARFQAGATEDKPFPWAKWGKAGN